MTFRLMSLRAKCVKYCGRPEFVNEGCSFESDPLLNTEPV